MTEPESPVDPLALVMDAAYAPLRDSWTSFGRQIDSELLTVLQNGLERHRAIVEQVGLASEAPADWADRSERLLQYRHTVSAELLQPLNQAGVLGEVATRISEIASSALAAAVTGCHALPNEVTVPWSEDALSARPHDSLSRRVAKSVARVVSRARKAGTPRSLPLRETAVAHVREQLAPALDSAAVTASRTWAEWSGRLERLWMAWGDEGLPALVLADLPESDAGASAHWDTIREVAQALTDGLARLIEESPHRAGAVELERTIAPTIGVLEGELAIAGSFLAHAHPSGAVDPTLVRTNRIHDTVATWNREVGARLELYESVLAVLSGTTAVQRRLGARMREKLLTGVEDLPAVASKLDGLLAETTSWKGGAAMTERLRGLKEPVSQALAPVVATLPDAHDLDETMQAQSDSMVDALLAMVRQTPTSLVMHPGDAAAPMGPRRAEGRSLALQDIARQAFDALRVERIRGSGIAVVSAVESIRADLLELPKVFDFAFDAATKELAAGEEGANERAMALVGEALRSIAESLRAVSPRLDVAMTGAQTQLANEIAEGALALVDRVAAGRLHARMLAAASRLALARAWVNEHWGPPVNRAAQATVARVRWAWTSLSGLVEQASEVISGPSAAQTASRRSLLALAHPGEEISALPLVYQRLFTLEPLDDGSLLAGRASELDETMRRWDRWKDEDGVPLVVRGRPGCGVTSFLNVLSANLREKGARVVRVTLDERINDAAAFAGLVAGALELPMCTSIDDLARAIFTADDRSLPDALVLDNLEHLYLRVPQGTDLIERVLTLMSETEPRIFWVAGIATSAWQLIAISEPAAASQIDVLDLKPLGAADVRAAIRLRHRRSGLPVRFQPSESGRLRWRRRLRQALRKDARDDDAEMDYFADLFRAAAGNLRLALFQWLVSANFEKTDGVSMSRPERPDFSVLDTLGPAQNFTLKAMLEHRTLSLDEHDRVFRLPRHESYQIVESLGNRHLLEPIATSSSEDVSRSEIEGDLRYRVQPLLVGVVADHLGGRNLIH